MVRESRERVRAALVTAGYDFPQRRITVNLSPADLPKEGGRFDLPIAVGILAADRRVKRDLLKKCEFYGELSLGGTAARNAQTPSRAHRGRQVRPGDNPARCECARSQPRQRQVAADESFARSVEILGGRSAPRAPKIPASASTVPGLMQGDGRALSQRESATLSKPIPDLVDVRGQFAAKRAFGNRRCRATMECS